MSERRTLTGALLALAARGWPSPNQARERRFGAEPGTPAYDRAYTLEQFMSRAWFGTPLGRSLPSLLGKVVLEI